MCILLLFLVSRRRSPLAATRPIMMLSLNTPLAAIVGVLLLFVVVVVVVVLLTFVVFSR